MENESKKITNRPCAICGWTKHSFYAEKNGCHIYRCDTCRVLSVFPLPARDVTAAVYGQEYFSGADKGFGYVDYDIDKQAMVGIFRRYLLEFKKILGGTGRLLDVGAATGFFMRLAEEDGWQPAGVEISAYAAGLGQSRGLQIEIGSLSGVSFPAQSFDVITMWDVLEHLPDPVLGIGKVSSLLKPGGLLAINTPNVGSLMARVMGTRWHLLVPPEHLYYFNRRSLAELLKKNGFDIIKTGSVGKRFTLEYIVHTLYRWQNLSVWSAILAYLKKHPKIGRLAIPLNLRDNMFILAQKK